MTEPTDPALNDGTRQTHYWHLAEDDVGVAVTDLEYAMMRAFESFVRWQTECLAAVSGQVLSGQENTLLHIIRMRGRSKTIRDLIHLTNRQDIANIQYGLRKLLKLGYIEKEGSGRVGVYYRSTPAGDQICHDYAELRKKLLLKAVGNVAGFRSQMEQATAQLEQIERTYEISAREAATFHRR